jgi:hypothetical protein
MQRTEAWYRAQAEKGRREVQQLLDESRSSRTLAGRMYPRRKVAEVPRVGGRSVPDTIASRLYPNLPRGD